MHCQGRVLGQICHNKWEETIGFCLPRNPKGFRPINSKQEKSIERLRFRPKRFLRFESCYPKYEQWKSKASHVDWNHTNSPSSMGWLYATEMTTQCHLPNHREQCQLGWHTQWQLMYNTWVRITKSHHLSCLPVIWGWNKAYIMWGWSVQSGLIRWIVNTHPYFSSQSEPADEHLTM